MIATGATKARKLERDIVTDIRLALARVPGLLVWRNNVGALTDARGRLVKYGLAVGSADLIGIYRGLFLAIEVKADGGLVRREQKAWLDLVKAYGGIAIVARSAQDVLEALDALDTVPS